MLFYYASADSYYNQVIDDQVFPIFFYFYFHFTAKHLHKNWIPLNLFACVF